MKSLAVVALMLVASSLGAQKPHQEIREVATRPPLPACSARGVTCLTDSTREVSNECCMSSAVASWLILPTPGDSLEFFASAALPSTAYVTLGIRGLRQFWQEHLPGLTASFLRQRFASRGTYALEIELEADDPVVGMPYELRFRQSDVKQPYIVSSVRLALSGRSARYRVTSVRSPDETKAALVYPGVYRVLGVPQDTLLVCKLPCRARTRVPLTGPAATIRL